MDEALREQMLSSGFYPHHPPTVEEVQTHISHVFIAPPFVYKVKKPVDFGFLDFRTLVRRRYFTHRELYLNSRFSPGLYLDVLPVTFDGREFHLSGDGEPVEYALKMRQFNGEKTMKNLIQKGEMTREKVVALAKRLAELHAHSHRVSPRRGLGSHASVTYDCEENFEQLSPFVGDFVDRVSWQNTKEGTLSFLQRHRDLFEARHRSGFIRDCHGDLHTEHVIFEGDTIYIFDCIEFNERFRYIDTMSDLSFLVMELIFMDQIPLSETLLSTYFAFVEDKWGGFLLDFYACYRATVRAKVHAFTAGDASVPEAQRHHSKLLSRAYLELAERLIGRFQRPYLIITMGFSGTGKTTVTQALAARSGIEVLRSDVIRRKVTEGQPVSTGAWNVGIYQPESRALVYETMFARAREILGAGRSICLDASFLEKKQREEALRLSRELQVNLLAIECACDEERVKQRLQGRNKEGKDPSDADFSIYQRQKEVFGGWDPIPSIRRFTIDTTHGISDTELSMLAAFVAR